MRPQPARSETSYSAPPGASGKAVDQPRPGTLHREAAGSIAEGNRRLKTELAVKIADEIARLSETAEWMSGDRDAVSLVKDDALNVLPNGAQEGRLRLNH